MRPQTFLFEIQFGTTFFDAMGIFGSVESQSESTFPFFYIIIWVSFEPPSFTLGGDRHMRSRTFFVQDSITNNFYLKFFNFWQHSSVNAKICAFSIDYNVNSSANDRGTIFGIMHASEPLK